MQREIAARSFEEKGDRKELDMLFEQLSPYWQQKVVKEESRQNELKHWVRMSTNRGLSQRQLTTLLKKEELGYQQVAAIGTGFNVQCNNEEEVTSALEMEGLEVGGQSLRVTRTNKTLGVSAIFKLVGDSIGIREEAASRGRKTEIQGRVYITEAELVGRSSELNQQTNPESAAGFHEFPGSPLPAYTPNLPQNPADHWLPAPQRSNNSHIFRVTTDKKKG